jgi:hypothetical protein
MDDQNFDDIIKGKLENYQDTGGFDEGALNQMLDNLPAAGGGGAAGRSGGLSTWAQSAWLPVGLAATLLFNVVLLTMVWQQKQTIGEVKQALKTVQTKTTVAKRDTIVVVHKDTVYIQSHVGINQAGFMSGAGYNFRPEPKTNFRNNNNSRRMGNYPVNNTNFLPQGTIRRPNTNDRQGSTKSSTSTVKDSLSLGGSVRNGGNNGNTTHTNPSRLSPAQKSRLIASLSVDSIRLLSRQEPAPATNPWHITMEKVPEPVKQRKKRKKRLRLLGNIGVQLGISAGVNSPIFNIGESNLAIPIGAKAEIGFGERLRLHTGIDFYSLEHSVDLLPVNEDYSETFPEIKDDEELEEIKSTLGVLEIPLQLRYTFGSRFANIKPFVGAGIMARKLTTYQSLYKYDEDEENELYDNIDNWRLSNYQVVLGADFYLKRNLSLQLHAHYNGRLSQNYNHLEQFNALGLKATLLFRLK